MGIYTLRRFVWAVPVVFGVSVLVFMMLHLVPGDPVKMMLSEFQTTQEQLDLLRSQLHLDESLPKQYARFVWGALHGDLGYSIRTKRPVSREITDNLLPTLELASLGLLVAAIMGIGLGILAALKPHSWVDASSSVFALLGISMPSFWLGLLMIFAFSLHLKLFPATGGGDLKHLVLPALTLGLTESAIIARLTRSSMLEVLRQEYIVVARSKGLRESAVLLRHALKNALIPVVTIFGLQFGRLLAGAVVVETVFGRPGIGRLIVEAIINKDFPLVQGIVLLVSCTYVLVNLIVDLAYGFLDPRIRYD